MPRMLARCSIVMLLGLSLLLAACGDSNSGDTLTLPTNAASPAVTTTTTATTAASSTASTVLSTATPVVNSAGQITPNATTAAATANTPKATTSPRPTPTPRPAIKPPTGFGGKLALLGADNALYVSRFDGKDPQVVLGKPGLKVSDTQDGAMYAWPSWSRDGNKLAVMALNFKGGTVTTSDVFIVGADGKNSFKVQDNSPDRPIFLSWSPDGSLLSLLVSSASSQLELRLLEINKGAAAAQSLRKVAQGQAIYTSWSPDSQQLSIHSSTSGGEMVALLAAKDAKAQAVPLKVTASSFRSPAFSPDGSRLAYGVTNAKTGNEDINIQDKTGTTTGHIETEGRGDTFSWSPGGNRLASSYILPNSQGLLYKGIAISELDAKPEADGKFNLTQVVNEPVLSYFWSPDGKKLAFAGFNDRQDMLTWKIYDTGSKKTTSLVEWYPSSITLQLLQYYDQYSQGNSIWSPDSKAIVFAGYSSQEVADITQSGNSEADPTVYVLPIEGAQSGKLVPVAAGVLAFWSK